MSAPCWYWFHTIIEKRGLPFDDVEQFAFVRATSGGSFCGPYWHPERIRYNGGGGFGSMTSYKKRTLTWNNQQDDFESPSSNGGRNVPIYNGFYSKNDTFGSVPRGLRDGLVWYYGGRKLVRWQYRNAFSFDDVAQISIWVRSAYLNNCEKVSRPFEELCDEFVPLVSLRFQGVETIDVIERNRPPKNSVALEPGDLEVDFVPFFSMFLGGQKWRFRTCRGAPSDSSTLVQVHRYTIHRYTGAPVHQKWQ